MRKLSLAAALLIAAPGTTYSQQQDITWTQTLNIPKGKNLSRDRADILGIEIGDTYEEAKSKLQKLASEGIQPKQPSSNSSERLAAQLDGEVQRRAYQEESKIFKMQAPNAATIVSASFPARLNMVRQMPGTQPFSDSLSVYLSAPSSGHQVVAISRSITYFADADQPRVSDLMAQLEAKYKTKPQVFPMGVIGVYRFQFNEGQPFVPRNPTATGCVTSTGVSHPNGLPSVNQTGDCDVVMEVRVNYGLSTDHAKLIWFTLSDNDRLKANTTADYAYINEYMNKLQNSVRGAPPKL